MPPKTIHFCTLFNSYYLTRGLALYASLEKQCPNFKLYVIAFDDVCYDILSKLALPSMIVISLKEFEDPELLAIKPTRNAKEYCWTCSSASIYYTIKKYNLDMCTYIDADMLFFDDPRLILDEMKEKSVLLTEQRLPKNGAKEEKNGTYCVQFMPFKNDENGMRALTWWREQCILWCYDRFEDGKIGDQKYLDDWTTRFPGVHVMQHIGGGVAPWNVYRYTFNTTDGKIYMEEKETGIKAPLIFYHFQSTHLYNAFGKVKAFYYPYDIALDHNARYIYDIYENSIEKALALTRTISPSFERGFNTTSDYLKTTIRKLQKTLDSNLRTLAKKALRK